MLNFLPITLLATAATLVSAWDGDVDILFKRYAHADCNGLTHIAKDTHLHNPHCKTFDHHEPNFYGFSFAFDDAEDHRNAVDKYCEVIVFEQADCQGKAFTLGNMNQYSDTCNAAGLPGRSVKLSCKGTQSTSTGSVPQTTTSWVTKHTVLAGQTASPTTNDETTLTFYPEWETGFCGHCSKDDGE